MPERECCRSAPSGPRARLAAHNHTPVRRIVALVGNPNVGKSSVFNALTGQRRAVGNWTGRTVDAAAAAVTAGPYGLAVVDLPGAYSLAASSPEERVTRDSVVRRDDPQAPEALVIVLDAANLERTLYLAAEALDTGLPAVVALTMSDVAASRGARVDPAALAAAIGVPVVAVDGRTGGGAERLAAALADLPRRPAPHPVYAPAVESELAGVAGVLAEWVGTEVPLRFLAAELLTGEPAAVPEVPADAAGPVGAAVTGARERLRAALDDDDLDAALAEERFSWAAGIAAAAIERVDGVHHRLTGTDRLDRVLTHRWFGLPLALLVLWAVFEATTRAATPVQDLLDRLVTGPVAGGVSRLVDASGLGSTWVRSFAVDGLVGGVGTVLTFVPIMLVMYLALGVLEESGYLARVAFVMDRPLRRLGLPGRAFLPLLLGFGCNVPALAGTRILSGRDRILTALLVPYVSCAARLPVYVLLAEVFFPGQAGTVVFLLYVSSIVVVLLVGSLFGHTVLRTQARLPFVLELSPYRLPGWPVARTAAAQAIGFIRNAGTTIVTAMAAIWLLMAIPVSGAHEFGAVPMSDSAFGAVSSTVAPVFVPAGFGDEKATSALLTGVLAKEAVAGTLGQVYGEHGTTGGTASGTARGAVSSVVSIDRPLRDAFDRSSGGHGPAAAAAFLVFVLAYTPCLVTMRTQVGEIGRRWGAFAIISQTAVAWALATAVFTVGRVLT